MLDPLVLPFLRIRRWRCGPFALVIFVALAACSPPEPVRIGFIGGISGRVADLGISGRNGTILAAELRNQGGGIGGRPIEVIVEDDQQDPELARQAVARLLARRVEVIIGPMTSAMAVAVVGLVNAARIPMISPTVTTNALTGIDDHFFRVVAPTATHVAKSAEYQFDRQHVRRAVLVCDRRNQAYSTSWAGDFRRAFEALGGKVVAEMGFATSDTLSALARQILAVKPDGVVIIANSVDTALLVQRIRLIDPAVPLATAEWAATERLIELGGKAVEGLVVAQYLDRESTAPAYLAFHRAYRERFAHEPGFAGLTAFDATNVAIEALASRTDGQTVKQALLAHGDFAGTQSPIRFDASGDTLRDTFLAVVRDGRFEPLRQ